MDLDRDAQRILDLASDARAPGADDRARMDGKLSAVLGAAALAGASQAGAAHASTAGTSAGAAAHAAGAGALKWWLTSALLASAVAGYVTLSRHAPEPAVQRQPPIRLAPPPPVVEPTNEAPALEPAPDPAEQAPLRAISHAKPKARGTLSDELELLHRAQAAWRAHEAPQALALIDQHKRRFPRSELRLEREGLRVLTLCELGRTNEARALAHKLLDKAPRSPLRATIEESCALK